jgi:hypothetical protein
VIWWCSPDARTHPLNSHRACGRVRVCVLWSCILDAHTQSVHRHRACRRVLSPLRWCHTLAPCTTRWHHACCSVATCSQPWWCSLQSGTSRTRRGGCTRPSQPPAWCTLQLCTSSSSSDQLASFAPLPSLPLPSLAAAADALRGSRASPPSHPFHTPRRTRPCCGTLPPLLRTAPPPAAPPPDHPQPEVGVKGDCPSFLATCSDLGCSPVLLCVMVPRDVCCAVECWVVAPAAPPPGRPQPGAKADSRRRESW